MFFLLFFSACTPTKEDSHSTDSDTGEPQEETPEWGYSGDIGPEHWGELDETWTTCADGMAQSPIDFDPNTFVAGDDWIELNWGETGLHAYNSGHYIRYDVDPGSTVTTANGTFDLLQFHFHGLSEHTVSGTHFEMEAHFVHQSQDNPDNLLVVGMFIDGTVGDTPTDALSSAGDMKFHEAVALPVSETTTDLGGSVDLSPLAETVLDSVSYDGSLTTPPCTEGVRFYISGSALKPAPEDTAAFLAVYDYNYRPTQPLNGRTVTVSGP